MDADEIDGSPTHAALETVLERAETVVEYQSDTLSDIDDKAIRIYRANVLFASVVIGAVSIAASASGPLGQILNVNAVAGMTLLVGSLAMGALTYRSSDLDVGPSPGELSEMMEGGYDRKQSVAAMVDTYGAQIEQNDAVIERNARLITYTTIATVDALAYVAAGAFVGVAVEPGTPIAYAILPSLVALPVVVGASKVLAFPDRSGHRFLAATVAVLAVPVVATVLQGWLFRGVTELVWILVPLYFVTLSLVERTTGLLSVRSYFIVLSGLVSTSTVALTSPFDSPNPTLSHEVLPVGPIRLVAVVGSVDLALFVLVGSVLLLLDYRIYRANVGEDD